MESLSAPRDLLFAYRTKTTVTGLRPVLTFGIRRSRIAQRRVNARYTCFVPPSTATPAFRIMTSSTWPFRRLSRAGVRSIRVA